MLSVPLTRQLSALHGAAYGWALHCTGRDPHAARDVLQTSYARVLGSPRPGFSEAGPSGADANEAGAEDRLRAYLFGVIRNVAREEFRRASTEAAARDRRAAECPTESPAAEDPARAASRAELREGIDEALNSLSPRQRELLHLTFYQGLSIEQAAEVLEIGLGSARTHYERGKEALRNRCASLARHLP